MTSSNEEKKYYVTGSYIEDRETKKANLIFIVELNQQKISKPFTHWIPKTSILEVVKIEKAKKLFIFQIEGWKFAEIEQKTNGKMIIPEEVVKPLVSKNNDRGDLYLQAERISVIKDEIKELRTKINQLATEKGRIYEKLRGDIPDWINFCKSQGKGKVFSINSDYSRVNFQVNIRHKLKNEKDLFEELGEDIYKIQKKKMKAPSELRKQFGDMVLGGTYAVLSTIIQDHHPKFISIAHRSSMVSLLEYEFDGDINNGNLKNLISNLYIVEDRIEETLVIDDNNQLITGKMGNSTFFKFQFGVMDILYMFQGNEKLGSEYFEIIKNTLILDDLISEYCECGDLGAIEDNIKNQFSKIISALFRLD